MTRPDLASPSGNVALLHALLDGAVEFVLAGSFAAASWDPRAIESAPRDLDVVPDLAPGNLTRLAHVLERLGARPLHLPEWKESLTPEECARWTPWPATEERLDHLLETPHGRLDVVPRRAGLHAALAPRAAALATPAGTIRVAHPLDLLGSLRPDVKPAHRSRRERLEALTAAGVLPPPRWPEPVPSRLQTGGPARP